MNDVSGVMRKFKQNIENHIETFKKLLLVFIKEAFGMLHKFIVATCFCNKTIFLNLKNGKMYLVHLNEDKLVMFEILLIKSFKRIKREI